MRERDIMNTCHPSTSIRGLFIFGISVCISALVTAVSPVIAAEPASEETWESIRGDLFEEGVIEDGSHLMTLETPYRAQDAAMVPFKFVAKPGVVFESVSIVIDENPAPLAATFTYGPAAGDHSFTTRFRVNSYSHVRAVARTPDGKLYMVRKFVKASGGCSAPASKDIDLVMASIGKMKLRQFGDKADKVSGNEPAPMSKRARQAQVMIRHPNFSGLQMDQVTFLYVPARFLDKIDISQGEDLVMRIEGGISISEDPNIRFYYKPDGAKTLSIHATDTDGLEFSKTWNLDANS